MIRLPEFVTRAEFDWAVQEATTKKKKDFSKVEFFTYDEGLCVQCMHIGSYDTEPGTLRQLDAFAAEQGYCPDRFQDPDLSRLRQPTGIASVGRSRNGNPTDSSSHAPAQEPFGSRCRMKGLRAVYRPLSHSQKNSFQ